MHGTSMAAGFASGVAAMVLSNDLSLTPSGIKAIIEKSVDLDYGLYDDVSAAGRINAYNALTLLSDLSLTADATQPDQVSLSWAGATALSATISVQRRAENQTGFQDVAQINASENGYTDENLPDGGVYYYRVLAQTLDGRSGYSPQVLAAPEEHIGASGSSGGSSGGGGCFVDSLLSLH
jgi:subtilisin family serine protease